MKGRHKLERRSRVPASGPIEWGASHWIAKERSADELARLQELRQQKVIAALESGPHLKLSVLTDGEAMPDILILTIAVRGLAAFDMHMPASRFDTWNLIEVITRNGGGVTE